MHIRTNNAEVSRLSISSAPSCSSQGSRPDDIESLGDVYLWGAIWIDGLKADVLLPKPMESDVVLDVQKIDCGSRHIALATRQGEVFTWGEESGGRLGHGVDANLTRPRLVESLALCNVDYVACGEYHTCAITTAGDLFTWGHGGLLGHESDASLWIPKRVSGPLDGIRVLSVACGTYHSALTASNGKVYTFGDGTFGALGHGDMESNTCPKEIECLNGLRTVKVACGVWHTAAIVEVLEHAGTNVVSRKLFTWGDGDKYRLGHGDKEARLIPTCVLSLIDYNFHQLVCGDDITIALATSGHVFTMGSSAHGQLGNPQSDGKVPCLVQDRLVGELVEEIACGSNHAAVLTSRSEIYTWGSGANGRLGHGDIDDRDAPILVEALKDRHAKSISCGSNFTACICIHKWASGADQSACTGCRQAFGFTRKRHHCYNCGLVYCHACSSKKILKAALAPTPGKPHRVCDSCHTKLKLAEAGGTSAAAGRKSENSRKSMDFGERANQEVRRSKMLLAPTHELRRYCDGKYAKNGPTTANRALKSSTLQLKGLSNPNTLSLFPTAAKPATEAIQAMATMPASPHARVSLKFITPSAWKLSASQLAALEYSGSMIETLKKTKEHLDKEVLKLQVLAKNLKHKIEQERAEGQKALKKAKEASIQTANEIGKFNAAMELIRTFETQIKALVEKLPSDHSDTLKSLHTSIQSFLQNSKNGISLSKDKSILNSMKEAADHQVMENGVKSPQEVQTTEQFEPGVYVTLTQLGNDAKVFKRVRFSRRKFSEQQAEDWWRENQGRVLQKYSHRSHSRSLSASADVEGSSNNA